MNGVRSPARGTSWRGEDRRVSVARWLLGGYRDSHKPLAVDPAGRPPR